MEPLKNATSDVNRQPTGFMLANNQPLHISDKARRKALEAASELFAFGNIDIVDELISVKRKAYTDPEKSAKKKKVVSAPKVELAPPPLPALPSDWDEKEEAELNLKETTLGQEDDEEINWSDCDADLSRVCEDVDKSLRDCSSEENSFRSG